MVAQKIFLVTLGLIGLIGCVWSYSYGGGGAFYEAVPYVGNSVGNSHSYADASQPSASRISSGNWPAVNHYGYQIGNPLLVRDYGHLTDLFSALAPKRSFVGVIDSGFYKDYYGKIKFRDESSIGAIAL